jgi:hypothetical protein
MVQEIYKNKMEEKCRSECKWKKTKKIIERENNDYYTKILKAEKFQIKTVKLKKKCRKGE